MKNIFIDCGSHFGEGYEEHVKILKIDNSWNVYMFEPNRICYEKIQKYKKENVEIFNKAVWNKDDKLIFRAEKAGNTQQFDGMCSTLLSNDEYTFRYGQESYEVETINLSKFIMNFPEDNIINVKMDIEGAEFETIREIIDSGAIKRIKYLCVEWHAWTMTDKEKYKKIEDDMINEIQNNYKDLILKNWK
jgi:FkbM family methyltransferase